MASNYNPNTGAFSGSDTTTTAPSPAKPQLSKEEMLNRAASMIYQYGFNRFGERPPGGFASIGGIFTYGTHRDGRKGILLGKKFIPISDGSAATPPAATSGASPAPTPAPQPVQQPSQASQGSLYAPIDTSGYNQWLSSLRATPNNYNDIQRYLDPRYRGGM